MTHIVWGVILASGREGQLSGGIDVAFLSLGANPVISFSLRAFEKCPDVDHVAVVVPKDRTESLVALAHMFGCAKLHRVITGTVQRQSSVQAALRELDGHATIVVMHEVTRPCVSSDLISETVKAAKRYGTGVAALRMNGSLKRIEKGLKAKETIDGAELWCVQTPQAFRIELLSKAMAAAAKSKKSLPDEASAFDLIKSEVHLVPSSSKNVKIATADDLTLAGTLVRF